MEQHPEQIVLGDVTVTRIKEFYGSVEMTPGEFFPDSPDGSWDEHRGWLAPDFWNPETDECHSAIQSWLLRSEGRTILVDTGVGNHKDRPYAQVWSRRDSGYLGTNTEEGHLYVAPQSNLESSASAELRSAVLGEALFGAGTARMTQAHAQISGGRTHVYSFGHRSTALNGRLGATHTVELPFVFDIADKPWLHGDTGLLGPDPAPGGLATRMHAAWVAFARTGDPGWATYDPHRPGAADRVRTWGAA